MSTTTAISALELIAELDINNAYWYQSAISDTLSDVHCVWQNMPRSYGSDTAFDGNSMDHEEFTLLSEDEYHLVVEFLQAKMVVLRAQGQNLPRWGTCRACGAIEVELKAVTGTVDLSGIGESAHYLTGWGCELCS